MNVCRSCGEEKEAKEFCVRQANWCKSCRYKYMREWKDRNRERSAQHRYKRREKQREYYKNWYSRQKRVYKPGQKAAMNALNRAIAKGLLKRPFACSKCGRGQRIEGHHPDYSKPLEVLWLCNRCHRVLHPG